MYQILELFDRRVIRGFQEGLNILRLIFHPSVFYRLSRLFALQAHMRLPSHNFLFWKFLFHFLNRSQLHVHRYKTPLYDLKETWKHANQKISNLHPASHTCKWIDVFHSCKNKLLPHIQQRYIFLFQKLQASTNRFSSPKKDFQVNSILLVLSA